MDGLVSLGWWIRSWMDEGGAYLFGGHCGGLWLSGQVRESWRIIISWPLIEFNLNRGLISKKDGDDHSGYAHRLVNRMEEEKKLVTS